MEAHILRSPQRNPRDTGDMLQAELANRFPSLLLVARVNSDGGSSGDAGLPFPTGGFSLVGVGCARGVVDLGALLGGRVVGQLFNAWVRHLGGALEGKERC